MPHRTSRIGPSLQESLDIVADDDQVALVQSQELLTLRVVAPLSR